jgi:Rap guanine nucleotide exchange factor 1
MGNIIKAIFLRLQWSKKITDPLKNYEKIIESEGRFGNYRKELGAVQPPCIPYIGMILKDLIQVDEKNEDFMHDDNLINFTKRWRQYDIILTMQRFRYQ